MNLHPIDIAILVVYLLGIVCAGLYLRRRAAGGVEDYFLAGRKTHWLFLAMSGSVTTYDITGTMWIVAMFYTMGLKGMWIHWSWGFMMPAFFMTFAGKWVRRSNVVTGAEWIRTRFGEGIDGRIARQAYAVMAIVFCVGLIGYAFQGIGKFSSVYLPVSETTGALFIISIISVYVILGGMYSVIFADVIQTVILTIAAFMVAVICYNNISYESLVASVPEGWLDIMPGWQPEYLANTDYQFFGLMCIAWTVKGMMLNAGGPGQLTDFQRFLSARNARESCKLGAAWSFFLVSRWAMCIGITALAITGIAGVSDTEKVLPFVLNEYLPVGLKGIILAGFIAAFMSTFDSTINVGASYIVEDFYRALFNPDATRKQLTRASYLASLSIIIVGVCVGFNATSITSIWNWLIMVFSAGFLIPNLLRWYWWRFNGWGVVGSVGAGMFLCFFLTIVYPEAPIYVSLYIIIGGSFIAAIIATFATPATDRKILHDFYASIRPGGWWRPIKNEIGVENIPPNNDNFTRDAFNTVIALAVVLSLYLMPVYAVIHHWTHFAVLAGAFVIGSLILMMTWYPYLPED